MHFIYKVSAINIQAMTSHHSTHQRDSQQKKGSISRLIEPRQSSFSRGKRNGSYHDIYEKSPGKPQNDLSTSRAQNEFSGNSKKNRFLFQSQTDLSDESDISESIKHMDLRGEVVDILDEATVELTEIMARLRIYIRENSKNNKRNENGMLEMKEAINSIQKAVTQSSKNVLDNTRIINGMVKAIDRQNDFGEKLLKSIDYNSTLSVTSNNLINQQQKMIEDLQKDVAEQRRTIQELQTSRDEQRKFLAEQEKYLSKQQAGQQDLSELEKGVAEGESVTPLEPPLTSSILQELHRIRASEKIPKISQSWMGDTPEQKEETNTVSSQNETTKAHGRSFDQKRTETLSLNVNHAIRDVFAKVALQQKALLDQEKSLSKTADGHSMVMSNTSSKEQTREQTLVDKKTDDYGEYSDDKIKSESSSSSDRTSELQVVQESSAAENVEPSEISSLREKLSSHNLMEGVEGSDFNGSESEARSEVSSNEETVNKIHEDIESGTGVLKEDNEPTVPLGEKIVRARKRAYSRDSNDSHDSGYNTDGLAKNVYLPRSGTVNSYAHYSEPDVYSEKDLDQRIQGTRSDSDEYLPSDEDDLPTEGRNSPKLFSVQNGDDRTKGVKQVTLQQTKSSDADSGKSRSEDENQATTNSVDRSADLVNRPKQTKSTTEPDKNAHETDSINRLVVFLRPYKSTLAKGLRGMSKEIRAALGPESTLEMFRKNIAGNLKIYIIQPTDEGIYGLTNLGVLTGVGPYEEEDLH